MGLKPAANSIKVLDVTILGAWGRKQGFLGFLCIALQFGGSICRKRKKG